ncbi:MAG TPA: acyl-CoA thioester hydrolase/BAAT C-terminal domain-containing protein [Brevundimonas sp.]|uniref:dienelactone hydrolase family protein n=2 Tax=Brevundimonas TaxID=41275 RepID=UPI002BB37A60|nr:acyl-CoA thioester hydrolase/BAAT C-terminal domain-containing protein [Brevundimonas sp.]HRO34246.1 acyl-CoA thioester hydrolase/BAAT C-terminal domain-containing protein [Brevundimonas sp.]
MMIRPTRRLFAALGAAALMLGVAAPALAQTVTRTPIQGFPHAAAWRLDDGDARPVVVILHGADGGTEAGERFGPILARMGYVAVGLPYYSPDWGQYGPPKALPELSGSFVDIPVDQLARLRDTLAAMPGVDIEQFALFAGSKGSEFALIAASRYDWIDAVVAYTPSDIVWEGWGLETLEAEGTRSSFAFEGQALPFMPYRGFVEGLLAGDAADLRAIHENGRADHPEREAAARIPVENYGGALLLIAGEKDAQWNAARQARNIQATRQAAGLRTEVLIYPEAGHDLIGDGGPRQAHRSGGTPEANAAARADAWPRVAAFLANALTY